MIIVVPMGDKVLMHLASQKIIGVVVGEKQNFPKELTQGGISCRLGVSQRYLSVVLRRLTNRGLIKVVKGSVEREGLRKVYLVTEDGFRKAREIEERLAAKEIVMKWKGLKRRVTLSEALELAKHKAAKPVSFIEILLALRKDSLELEEVVAEKGSIGKRLGDFPTVRYFFGRSHELVEFTEGLRKARVLVIRGIAGIGKTTFLAKALESYQAGRTIFWYKLYAFTTPIDFMRALGDSLRLSSLKTYLQYSQQPSLYNILYILRETLKDKDILVVIDDVHLASKDFVDFLSALKDTLVILRKTNLITAGRTIPRFYTRKDVHDGLVKELLLEGLDMEAARKLWLAKKYPSESFVEAYRLTKGHPLLLELIRIPTKTEGVEDAKRYFIEEIYEKLPNDEKMALGYACVFRVPFTIHAFLVASTSFDIHDALVNKTLLRRSDGTYRVHDLVKSFMKELLKHNDLIRFHMHAANYYSTMKDSASILECIYHIIKAGRLRKALSLLDAHAQRFFKEGMQEHVIRLLEELSTKSLTKRDMLRVMFLMGDAFLVKSDFRNALKPYERILKLCKELKGRGAGNLSRAYLKLGTTYCQLNDYDVSIRYLKKSIRKLGVAEKLLALYWMGACYFEKGLPKEALKCFQQISKSAHRIKDWGLLARSYRGYEAVYRLIRGDYEKAVEYGKRALLYFEKQGDEREIASSWGNLAFDYEKIGKYDLAIHYLRRALKYSVKVKDAYMKSKSLFYLSGVYLSQKRLKLAEKYCELALDIAREMRLPDEIADRLRKHARIMLEKALYKQAYQDLKEALKFAEMTGNVLEQAETYELLAKVYDALGKSQDAARALKRALKLYEELGIKHKLLSLERLLKGIKHTKPH